MRTARTLEAKWRQLLWGSVGMGTKEDESSTGRLDCRISPCDGPVSLGAGFETYEPFISLIFKFFSGCGQSRILNQRIWGHDFAVTLKLCCAI
jgi:hypothetical protein